MTSLINARRKRREQANIDNVLHGNTDDYDGEMFYSLAENDASELTTNEHELVESTDNSQTVVSTASFIQNGDNLQGKDYVFYAITCSFLIFSFIVAMSVDDLGVVLGIVGATGSTIVSYILPGAVYIKLHPQPHSLKIFAYFQLLLGIIMMPTALFFVVFKGGGG